MISPLPVDLPDVAWLQRRGPGDQILSSLQSLSTRRMDHASPSGISAARASLLMNVAPHFVALRSGAVGTHARAAAVVEAERAAKASGGEWSRTALRDALRSVEDSLPAARAQWTQLHAAVDEWLGAVSSPVSPQLAHSGKW